jgi:hypothetical protein
MSETHKDIKEQIRVYSFEVNLPYSGKKNMVFRKEKLYLLDNNILTQTQMEPLIKNYGEIATNLVTVFDPITNQNVTISAVALIEAIQRIGQEV